MGGDKLGRGWRLLVAAATTVALLGLGSGAGTAHADPEASTDEVLSAATQPTQPTQGPGGSSYAHGDWTISSGGSGNDAWYVFQPTSPRPTSAPVSIMLHGFGEFSGHDSMYQFIRHTVRQGNIVIYPRWQTGIFSPWDIEGRMTAASNGIKGALNWLQAGTTNRVQPQLDRVSYFGFSYGGIIATNLANRHTSMSLPTPRVLFLDEPHDGFWEADLDDSLSGIPSSVRLNCLVSDDITAGEAIGCKTMWPLLGHVPAANKDYVVAYDDAYGSPALAAAHGLSSSTANGTYLDAYDYYAVWKIFDALRSCTFSGTYCEYGLGNTAQHRSMGLWSDGRPVRELAVSDSVIDP